MTSIDGATTLDAAEASGWFAWQGPRLRFLPILLVFVLSQVILIASFFAAAMILRHTDARLIARTWPLLMIAEPFEFGFALLGIAIARRWLPDADFGLRWPRGKTMIGKAVAWGALFAVIMLLVDHGARLFRGHAPVAPAERAVDVAGWLFFELFVVGVCEETLFRGFLLGLLERLSPSRVRTGGFSLSTAGYTIAILFALAHIGNFATRAWPVALGQQLYAVVLGVVYAWLRERSGSVVAPSVSHSVGDFGEDALVFALARLLPR